MQSNEMFYKQNKIHNINSTITTPKTFNNPTLQKTLNLIENASFNEVCQSSLYKAALRLHESVPPNNIKATLFSSSDLFKTYENIAAQCTAFFYPKPHWIEGLSKLLRPYKIVHQDDFYTATLNAAKEISSVIESFKPFLNYAQNAETLNTNSAPMLHVVLSLSQTAKYLNAMCDYLDNLTPLKSIDDYPSSESYNEYLDSRIDEIASVNDEQPIVKNPLNTSTVEEFKKLPLPQKTAVIKDFLKSSKTFIEIVLVILGSNALLGPININLFINSYNNVVNSCSSPDTIVTNFFLNSNGNSVNYFPKDLVASPSAVGDDITIRPLTSDSTE